MDVAQGHRTDRCGMDGDWHPDRICEKGEVLCSDRFRISALCAVLDPDLAGSTGSRLGEAESP